MNGTLEGVYNRALGTFAHPNIFAYFLSFIACLIFYFVLRGKKNNIEDVWLIFLLPIILFLLVFTYTRGAWLMLIIALAPIATLKHRQLIVIGLIASLLGYASVDIIQQRVNEIFSGSYTSLDWRIDLWKDSIRFAMDKPVLGFGSGVAKIAILNERGADFGSSDAHNDYIKIFIENGLLGLMTYIILIFSLIKNILVLYKKEVDEDLKNFILIFLGSIAALALSLTDNIMRQTALEWIIWSLAGGIFAIKKTAPLKEKRF